MARPSARSASAADRAPPRVISTSVNGVRRCSDAASGPRWSSRLAGGVRWIQWSVNETCGMSEVPARRMWHEAQSPVMASARLATPGREHATSCAAPPAPWHDWQARSKWLSGSSALGRCGSWHVVQVIGRAVPALSWKQALRAMRSAWLAMPNASGSSTDCSLAKTERWAASGRPGR